MSSNNLIREHGDTVILKGWRNVTLVNIGAVLIPALGGIGLLLAGSWWTWVGFVLLVFAIYGAWTIYRSCIVEVEFQADRVVISGTDFPRGDIEKFVGRRFNDEVGIDDKAGSSVLCLKTSAGEEISIIAMSQHAEIDQIASNLNQRLDS